MTSATSEEVEGLRSPHGGTTDFADFLEHAPLGAQSVRADGRILWANQALLDLLGYGAGEYIGHELAAFHADQRVVSDILTRLARHETLRNYEAPLVAKDGSIRHVLIDSNVLWQKGRFLSTRCFVRDITERKRLEAEVREQRRALELLSASSRELAAAGFELPRIFEVISRQLAEALGDACVVRLLAEDGLQLGVQAAHHRDPDVDARMQQTIADATPSDEGLCGAAIRTGRLVTADDDELPAAMSVPLKVEGRTFGTIAVARHSLGRPYTVAERGLLAEVATRASLAIFAARQHLELLVERSKYQQENRRLDAVLRQLPSGVLLLDPSGRLLLINDRAKEMFRESFALETDLRRFAEGPAPFRIHAADGRELPPSEWPIFRTIVTGETMTGEEFHVLHPDGSILTVRCSTGPVRNRAGDIVAGILICADITAEKRIEDQLKVHSQVLQSMTEGVCLTDEHGVIQFTNAAEDQMFGYPRGELVGKDLSVLSTYAHPDNPPIEEVFEQLRASGAWSGEFTKTRRDGTIFVTRAHITALDIQGRTHWLMVHDDVTDEKRSQAERETLIAELQREVRFSDMFMGILGHDLRNPLGAILMTGQLLAKNAKDEPTRAALKRIISSGRRMSRMIEQLLDLTRVRLGRGIPVEPGPLDLARLCQAVADELATQPSGEQIHLEVLGDARGLWDLDRLGQLVSNLLGNATQYRTEGTPVEVTIDGEAAAEVILRVHNQGHIPADKLPLLFEPFKPREPQESRSGGLGLGLSISQQIARAHGGSILVSSSPEAGTTFEVRLPREAAPDQLGAPAAPDGGADASAFVVGRPEEPTSG